MNILLWSLAGGLMASLFMALLWGVQRRIGNAGVVDVGWAFGIAALAVAYTLLGPAPAFIRIPAGLMGALWGFRLAWHIHRRGHGKPEDGRYAQLRQTWGAAFQRKLFFFYQAQALTVALFALPYLLVAVHREAAWSGFHIAGLLIWTVGWFGESLADAQLESFKRDPARPGTVCQSGLWRYSRHPNYFFEWLTWVGLAIYALPSPYGWVALIAPAAILHLLLNITGIPATEEQALRSKGDAYRRYQATTNAFFPGPPRKDLK